MLRYKEVLGKELNIGDVVLLKRYYDGGLLLNIVTAERNEIDLYLYKMGQELSKTLCYKLNDDSILNYLNDYDYNKSLKYFYNDYQNDVPIFDILNREVKIGDLVIYNILESGVLKFGIVNSEKTVLTDTGRSKKVNQVLLLSNLNDYEMQIKESLSDLVMKNIKTTLVNKSVDLKNINLTRGDIFGNIEDTCYYIYIGKACYNVYHKHLNKDYPSDEFNLVLKVVKTRKGGKAINKYLNGENLTFEFLLKLQEWKGNSFIPFYLSEFDFNFIQNYSSDGYFKYMSYLQKSGSMWLGIDKHFEGLDDIKLTKFNKKRDMKVFATIPINSNNIIIRDEEKLRFELVIL